MVNYKQRGYMAGLAGLTSLPPMTSFQARLEYEKGYEIGRKARLQEMLAIDSMED